MTDSKHDISNQADIQQLVNSFYTKVREDELIGPVFKAVNQDHWQPHLDTMYTFWGSILLGEGSYYGRPFRPHIPLKIGASHFERWLKLFEENLTSQFEGPKATEALNRAKIMKELFMSKKARLSQM